MMSNGSVDWVPLIGSVEVVVRQASPLSIHGDAYVDVLAAPEGAAASPFRIPAHQFGSLPIPGDRLRLHLLMSQVDRVERIDAP